MQTVAVMARRGDVDLPMLYIVRNSWTSTSTGARLRVGTPAWEKHAMKPSRQSAGTPQEGEELPRRSLGFAQHTGEEGCASDAPEFCDLFDSVRHPG